MGSIWNEEFFKKTTEQIKGMPGSPLSSATFQIGDEEKQRLFDELLKMVSTQTSMGRNVAMEQSALSNSSDAAREASLRGVNYRGGMAVERGTTDLQKYISGYNRQGTQMAFQNQMTIDQLNLMKDAQETRIWQDLMGILGGGAAGLGQYAGYKLFSSGGN